MVSTFDSHHSSYVVGQHFSSDPVLRYTLLQPSILLIERWRLDLLEMPAIEVRPDHCMIAENGSVYM